MNKPRILVVLGPTATGKSDLAVLLARKYNGEIISADSRQVYEGMNVGTGKITKKEMRGVKHHLLDIASPKAIFNVDRFKKLGEKAIQDILKRNKLPIICGGTGFYIQALVEGMNYPTVKPNVSLRKKLAKQKPEKLFKTLQKLDPKRAETIDSKNPVRMIRAIEIATELGSVPSLSSEQKYDVFKIGLDLGDEILKERIHMRLIKRIKKGMIREVEQLHISGVSWKRLEALGLEYKYCTYFLQKKMSKQDMLTALEKEIWQYAKRQRTWFKRDKSIAWFKPDQQDLILKTASKHI